MAFQFQTAQKRHSKGPRRRGENRREQMRKTSRFSGFILAAMLTVAPAGMIAQTSAKKASKSTTVKASDVQQLREALAAQQEQMAQQRAQMDQLKAQLQQLIDANQQANAAAQKGQTTAADAAAAAAQAQQNAAEAQRLADQAASNAVEAKTALALVNTNAKETDKKVSALSDVLGRFRFSGDVRVRGESLFQDCPTCADRNRGRVRARFGFDSKINEDFMAGVYIATGSLADLTSANETFTNFFERKTIGLDRAFISYNPVAHPWMSLTGGKWAYTWTRTSLTFDPDINPEGFSEKFSWNLKNSVVKNFSVG